MECLLSFGSNSKDSVLVYAACSTVHSPQQPLTLNLLPWACVIQVAGGGASGESSVDNSVPTAAEFNVHGEGWQWGAHQVDSARAEGRYDQASRGPIHMRGLLAI